MIVFLRQTKFRVLNNVLKFKIILKMEYIFKQQKKDIKFYQMKLKKIKLFNYKFNQMKIILKQLF